MTRPLKLRFVRSAALQVREAVDWWRANRPSASNAVATDLRASLSLVRLQPRFGSRAVNISVAGVRRIYLSRVRYHVYYRLVEDETTLEVLAFWHASRGNGPGI